MQSSCWFCVVFSALLRNWDTDGRVNVLKHWDIRRSRCLSNHEHLSLYYHGNVRGVLFNILLGCGKDLLLVAAVFRLKECVAMFSRSLICEIFTVFWTF